MNNRFLIKIICSLFINHILLLFVFCINCYPHYIAFERLKEISIVVSVSNEAKDYGITEEIIKNMAEVMLRKKTPSLKIKSYINLTSPPYIKIFVEIMKMKSITGSALGYCGNIRVCLVRNVFLANDEAQRRILPEDIFFGRVVLSSPPVMAMRIKDLEDQLLSHISFGAIVWSDGYIFSGGAHHSPIDQIRMAIEIVLDRFANEYYQAEEFLKNYRRKK